MRYLNNDELERYWFQYKSEGEPHGTSLEQFCRIHRISYKALDNWRRQSKNKVYPVEVEGYKAEDVQETSDVRTGEVREMDVPARYISCRHRQAPSTGTDDHAVDNTAGVSEESRVADGGVRIMVSIKATNGLHIYQKNLDYERLLLLVERLEGLC